MYKACMREDGGIVAVTGGSSYTCADGNRCMNYSKLASTHSQIKIFWHARAS